MMVGNKPGKRILVAIPAYNEEGTIQEVIRRVRESLPDFDLLVVNDGSRDATGEILDRLGVVTATHLCNLGYGRAIQTAIKYALSCNYDVLITLDADGQHHPEQVLSLHHANVERGWDVLIGSRYVETRDYSQAPLGRSIGMRLFSMLVRAITYYAMLLKGWGEADRRHCSWFYAWGGRWRPGEKRWRHTASRSGRNISRRAGKSDESRLSCC